MPILRLILRFILGLSLATWAGHAYLWAAAAVRGDGACYMYGHRDHWQASAYAFPSALWLCWATDDYAGADGWERTDGLPAGEQLIYRPFDYDVTANNEWNRVYTLSVPQRFASLVLALPGLAWLMVRRRRGWRVGGRGFPIDTNPPRL